MNEQLKAVLLEAIQQAGDYIEKHFRTNFAIHHKTGINNLVTEVDQASEQLIRKIINQYFPDHSIIGEEYPTKNTESEYHWIIDPIDGTTNYAHGIPLCCVSIGIMYGENMLMGAVYNPFLKELFFAEKGKGAFLNDQPIHVSENADFRTAFLVTGFPYKADAEYIASTFVKLVKKGLPIRRLGSAALDLCWVACGRFDGFWEYNLNAWDIAAGYLIVEEAGGKVSDFQSDSYSVWDKETLATNGILHESIRKEILDN